ncbi:hypothetical protein Cyrtocomes_00555 [Candidatus Cyrtobacter comes]|uniref:Flagellar motor switch protein FliG C-terminal domain-containing protein n=1 Tax=Candidatus Cyrtobacter comes TaxID=675776 RepID=A0ABU5L7T8_9RICK|nr:hypothetical protein [Candidatus Cyrtobacter comes]MDZ5762184.1 hypothetical protein [Candidatus Cyrtobacter comes]
MKDNFDIIGFINAIGKIRLAFLNSPTKGIAIFEIIILHRTKQGGLLEDLIMYLSNFGNNEKNPQNATIIKSLEASVKFIVLQLKDERALKILKQARDSVIDEISTNLIIQAAQA